MLQRTCGKLAVIVAFGGVACVLTGHGCSGSAPPGGTSGNDASDDTGDEGSSQVLECTSAILLADIDSPTQASTITVSGTTSSWDSVEISGGAAVVTASVQDCTFSAQVPLAPNSRNRLHVRGMVQDGTASAPVPVTVTQDDESPSLFIDFPADGAEITTDTTDVAGRVGDMLSGFMGLSVNVASDQSNSIEAIVDVGIGNNGTFFAQGVPLANDGPITITATATDDVGNTITKEITVTKKAVPDTAHRMTILSGNRQAGSVNTLLPEKLVIQMMQPDGQPFGNKVVTFNVTRSNGRLFSESETEPTGGGSMMLQVRTDAAGKVAARWKLGSDAGCGNNRVEVSSASIVGTVAFCASAAPAPASQINIGAGNNQRVEVGAVAYEPLRVWVSDACNGIADIDVTFTVVRGDGKVDGQDAVTLPTARTGHAEVQFTLGTTPGNNAVRADFADNPTGPAEFVVFGVERQEGMPTSFIGLVLDNASQPIEGATCTLSVGANPPLVTASDMSGQFRFDDVAGSGSADLRVDGATAAPVERFPALDYEIVLTPGAENSLGTPVLLPSLNPNNVRSYSVTEDTELTIEGMEGLKMIVTAGSMSIGGQPALDGTPIFLNQVHHDDVPMPLPDGAAPPFAWILQPAGAVFDPPVQVIYPNMSGLPAGAIAYFFSFNQDTDQFEISTSGHVTADGSSIITDSDAGGSAGASQKNRTGPLQQQGGSSGSGISNAGWGCNCPPYSVTGECCSEACDAGAAARAEEDGTCSADDPVSQELQRQFEVKLKAAEQLAGQAYLEAQKLLGPTGPSGVPILAEVAAFTAAFASLQTLWTVTAACWAVAVFPEGGGVLDALEAAGCLALTAGLLGDIAVLLKTGNDLLGAVTTVNRVIYLANQAAEAAAEALVASLRLRDRCPSRAVGEAAERAARQLEEKNDEVKKSAQEIKDKLGVVETITKRAEEMQRKLEAWKKQADDLVDSFCDTFPLLCPEG